MAIYYIIFYTLAIFSFVEKFSNIKWRSKRNIIFLFSIVFIVLSTFYAGRMGDRDIYELFFNSASNEMLRHPFDGWFEYFYTILALLSKSIWNNYVFFRFVLALLVIGLWYKILSDKEEYLAKVNCLTILFVLWALYYCNIFIARSTIAITLCVYSIKYIEKKEFKKFLVILIFAIGFHTMSVVWIASYFIYQYRNNRRLMLWTFIAGFVTILSPTIFSTLLSKVIPFAPEYISRAFNNYLDAGRDEMFGMVFDIRLTIIKAMANMFILILLFMFIKRRERHNEIGEIAHNNRINGYFNLYLFGTILYNVSLAISIVLSRAAMPYTIVSVFLIPQIFELPEFKRSMASRLILFVIFLAYISLRFGLNMLSVDDFTFIGS